MTYLFIVGVAMEKGMVKALEDRLGIKVNMRTIVDVVCGIGVALLGLNVWKRAPIINCDFSASSR
jgi:activator of 2-hydroxyglutaryl-CoA dehydratase